MTDDTHVPLVVHVEERQKAALKKWADAEQRSVSAQTRIMLDQAVPGEYFDPTAVAS
jgi:hypothetical protein